jgi:hypothetical protein
MADTQISAYISDTTRDEVERYVEAHGVKKGSLVEQALLHHLQSLRELPEDIIIPPRLKVTEGSFAKVFDLIERSRKPRRFEALFRLDPQAVARAPGLVQGQAAARGKVIVGALSMARTPSAAAALGELAARYLARAP